MRGENSRTVRWLSLRGTIAICGAVITNAAILLAGTGFVRLPPAYRVGAPGPVVVPVAAAVTGTILYAILDRRSGRGYRTFLGVIGVGTLVSLVPVMVAAVVLNVGPGGVLVLATQHVVVAIVIAGAFAPRDLIGH